MAQVTSKIERKQELLADMQGLLEQRKILKARGSLKDFCEYVIKDEKSGTPISIADLQLSWINHIGFCKNNGINALILAPMAAGKCVAPETVFFTLKGLTQAQHLQEGDTVLSFDETTGKPEWTTITATEVQQPKEMFLIKLESGKTIVTTFDHPFLVSDIGSKAWVEARDMIQGDHVIVPSNWAEAGPSPDYYGYGLTSLTNRPLRFDLERLLEYKRLFDLDLDRAILEREGIVSTQKLGYDPHTFNREGICTYLGGVFDASANFNTSLKVYELEDSRKEELMSIQFLLQAIGIKSKIVRRIRPKQTMYSLLVSKEYVGNVQDSIKCILTNTRAHLPCRRTKLVSSFEESVTEVRKLGNEPSIGIETANHRHITNGLVTHNTQIVGIALPLYLLGKDPSTRIKIVCLEDGSAKDRLAAIQSYITDDVDYQKVFPAVKPDKNREWSKHNIFIERANKAAKDPSIAASGVLAGKIGTRCDMLLVDDIFDQRTAITQPATREQINQTFRIVWLSRIDKGGMAVVICTRWHERDLAGEILADPAMRDQYGILIQSINADFTGIDIQVIVPDRLREKYQKDMLGFTQV